MGFSSEANFAPEMDGHTRLHRFRYHTARGFVTPTDIVLDLGCGHGYGSQILSEVAEQVIGFDIDIPRIKRNIDEHQEDNLLFVPGNLEEIALPPCDVACSFEVIEHLYNPVGFIDKLKQVVKKWIVVSVPVGCEKLIEVNGDFQADLDSTHHYVFDTPDELDLMFVDADWKLFFGYRIGVTYLAIYYKYDL